MLLFYIPQVDGIGLVDRTYKGVTPLGEGLTFSKIAAEACGGVQGHGYMGASIGTVRSKKFQSGDGGWDRIVWIHQDLKKQVADAIPEEVYEKIATEDNAENAEDLKQFLVAKKHPIVEKFWKNGKPVPVVLPAPTEDWPEDKE